MTTDAEVKGLVDLVLETKFRRVVSVLGRLIYVKLFLVSPSRFSLLPVTVLVPLTWHKSTEGGDRGLPQVGVVVCY